MTRIISVIRVLNGKFPIIRKDELQPTMSHDIAFLHTGEVHIETFGALMHEIAPTPSDRFSRR